MISNFDVVKSGIDIWFQLHILGFLRGKIRVLHKYEISWIRVTMIEEFYIVFSNFSVHFDGIWQEKIGFLVWIRTLRTQVLLSLQRPVNQMAVSGQPDPSWPGCHMGRSGQLDRLWQATTWSGPTNLKPHFRPSDSLIFVPMILKLILLHCKCFDNEFSCIQKGFKTRFWKIACFYEILIS